MNDPTPGRLAVATHLDRVVPSALAAVYLLLSVGCIVEYIPVDPEVSLTDPSGASTGTPTAELGFYFTDAYTAFAVGDNLPVVNGLQGGTWTMPVIRIQHLSSFAEIECAVEMVDNGEVVGFMKGKQKFFLSPDGFYEALNVPIPVYHPGQEGAGISDLFGRMATVACSVTDKDERMAELEIDLTLAQGIDP